MTEPVPTKDLIIILASILALLGLVVVLAMTPGCPAAMDRLDDAGQTRTATVATATVATSTRS